VNLLIAGLLALSTDEFVYATADVAALKFFHNFTTGSA